MRPPVFQLLRIALQSMRKNTLRTFLLGLTTAIGIAGVVCVVSLVKGGTTAFRRDMSTLGVDVITFTDTGGGGDLKPLTDEVFDEVKTEFAHTGARFSLARIDLQKVIAPATGKSASCPVIEIDERFLDMFGLAMREGRGFTREQYGKGQPVCLIDGARARELFGRASPLGKSIEIKFTFKRLRLKVIGVVEDPMKLRQHIDRFDSGSLARDMAVQHLLFKNVYVMRGVYERALSRYSLVSREIPLMFVKPRDLNDIDNLHTGISSFLGERRVRHEGFTMNRWLDKIDITTQRINENSNLIWVIILAVAAVLIMLVNYLAVREKFREIAIRRVEGASRPAIIAQMAAESLFVSLLSGAGGVLIGVLLSHALCAWVVEWPPVFTLREMALAMGLALLVGMLATILPALRASQVDPAATLRYE